MVKPNFSQRVDLALRYLNFDATTEECDWSKAVELFNSNIDFGAPESLVLIHKRFKAGLGLDEFAYQGEQTFKRAAEGAFCRSIDIWGYECPYGQRAIHVDHSFPRSRGGATHPRNARYLCDHHNLMKSTDIHFYSWEKLLENYDWVLAILNQLSHDNEIKHGTRIYIDKLKLKRI
jgi:hypothetical protein